MIPRTKTSVVIAVKGLSSPFVIDLRAHEDHILLVETIYGFGSNEDTFDAALPAYATA